MNLTIRAPFHTTIGYGVVSWNIVKELYKKHQISVFPVSGQIYTPGEEDLAREILNAQLMNYDRDASCLTIWHEHDLIQNFIGKGEYIAFPFFEINQLEPIRQINLNSADKIIVTSRWAKEVLESNGILPPVFIAPIGVDTTIFRPGKTNNTTYRFFTIGKIEKRKCTEILSDVFAAAFDEKDDVELHIMCDSPLQQIKQQMPFIKKKFANSKLGDKIRIHGTVPSGKDVARFIQSMDCGLFLTRAEGGGLPILETMACGKPVITTDYSAHADFCNSTNAKLVNVKEFEPAHDGIWFHGLGTWAKIGNNELEQCVEYMRHCYKNRPQNQAGIDTANKMGWDKTANAIERTVNC